jgi:hypothetical protein
MHHHPLAIDVTDLQVSCFCATSAGGIHRHQEYAMEGCISGLNQSRNLFLA